MTEQYREYTRRQPSRKSKPKKSFSYTKKLRQQIIFSLIFLSSVYLLKFSDADFSRRINSQIKSALNYEVKTSQITDFLSNMGKMIIN